MMAGDEPPRRPLRIGVWCAVSSSKQAADDKVSLPDQERGGREFARAIGGEVVATYSVPGHTRDVIFWQDAEAAMPPYRALREDLQAGRLDVVWVRDPDRAGRDPALSEQMYSLARRNGAEVYVSTAPHPVGQQSSSHRYLFSIQSVRAGEEQDQRRYKLKSGMRGRVGRGLIANHPPLGYAPIRDAETGQVCGYEPSEHAEAILEMTRLFLAGHSYSEITRRLNGSPWRPPGGGRWHYSVVYSSLHNDTYAGLPGWGASKAGEPSDKFPALWEPAEFAAIVAERRRRYQGPYHRTGAGPLSGVAFCARCLREGRRGVMTRWHSKRKSRRPYLCCSSHARKAESGAPCHANNVAEWRVTAAIGEALSVLVTPAALDVALEQVHGGEEQRQLMADLGTARINAANLEKQRGRIGHALAAGLIDPAMYRTLDDDLLSRLAAEQGRAADLERAIAALPDLAERRASLERLAANFERIAAEMEPAEVAALLRTAGLAVLIENGQVVEVRI